MTLHISLQSKAGITSIVHKQVQLLLKTMTVTSDGWREISRRAAVHRSSVCNNGS